MVELVMLYYNVMFSQPTALTNPEYVQIYLLVFILMTNMVKAHGYHCYIETMPNTKHELDNYDMYDIFKLNLGIYKNLKPFGSSLRVTFIFT